MESGREQWISMLAMILAVLLSIFLVMYSAPAERENSRDEEKGILSQRDKTQSNRTKALRGIPMAYEQKLFDTTYVHTIDVEISESDWQDLKAHSLQKMLHDCNLVIDGERFYHVGIRTKGNSTLVQSMVMNWDRQSLVFEFGAFNESQRYYGLDRLSMYNNACDASCMRNRICFQMMQNLGVPASLCSYAAVYLNGEYVGLYTAIEGVEESFAWRNFGADHGNLYKPEQYDIAALLLGEPTGITINVSALTASSDSLDISDFLETDVSAVVLRYQGDDLSLYSEIWNKSIFKIGSSDKKRVVAALKGIASGENVWKYMDVQELAAYFAVNAFVLNTDNYLTGMAHNYYLREQNGVLSMLPWDYDQTLGTAGAVGDEGDMTLLLNTAIDTPVMNTTVEERPLLSALLLDDRGRELYHHALRELAEVNILSGALDEQILREQEMLRPYVQSDTFDASVQSIREFCHLRAQSICGQLEGNIPSTSQEQLQARDTLVDASGYMSPDSGSFFQMLMPEGSGIYLDDALSSLLSQVQLVSLLKRIPIEDLAGIAELGRGTSSGVEKLMEEGLVRDTHYIQNLINQNALEALMTLAMVVLSLVTVVGALVWIRRYGRNRQPAARERGKPEQVS